MDLPPLWNMTIARNPLNWIIVGLMVLLAMFALHVVISATAKPSTEGAV